MTPVISPLEGAIRCIKPFDQPRFRGSLGKSGHGHQALREAG
jgi:hypothetical protein